MKKIIILLFVLSSTGLRAMEMDDDGNQGKKRKFEEIVSEESQPNKKAKIEEDVVKILSENPFAVHQACIDGDYETLEKLVDFANLEFRNNLGETPLHLAVHMSRDPRIVDLLIRKRAMVDAIDNSMRTPLHLAAMYGLKEICSLLVENDADVNSLDQDGYTPLHFAIKAKFLEIVKLLVEHDADIEALPYDGDDEENRETPLLMSINDPEIAQFLIKNEADVRALDEDNNTPLHLCSTTQGSDTAKMLIQAGAKLNAKNVYRETPLFSAVSEGHIENVIMLINKGANVNVQSGNGDTPLHIAARNFFEKNNLSKENYLRIALLLSRLCFSNTKNMYGFTARDVFVAEYQEVLEQGPQDMFYKLVEKMSSTFSGKPHAPIYLQDQFSKDCIQAPSSNLVQELFLRQIGQGNRPRFMPHKSYGRYNNLENNI